MTSFDQLGSYFEYSFVSVRIGNDVLIGQLQCRSSESLCIHRIGILVRRRARPPVVPLAIQRIGNERFNPLFHARQRLDVHFRTHLLPHDESKRRLHRRLGRAALLPHLSPSPRRIQMELVTLLPLPRRDLIARLGQFRRARVLRSGRGVGILTQLTIPAGNPVQSFQAILAALLVGIGGSFVEIGCAYWIWFGEDSARHGLFCLEAIILGFCHFGNFCSASEEGDGGGAGGDAAGGGEDCGWAGGDGWICDGGVGVVVG
mmetsp:Transcript_28048/g.59821  ORF Transcript_28048/g.59821 Transcript_28048/m.59821 type:complete len:260 (-) Transcript_28048:246-1025(-)